MHFMSDAILSDCLSAAICHTATTCNGMLVGMFNLYCLSTSTVPSTSAADAMGQHNKIGGITLEAALIY